MTLWADSDAAPLGTVDAAVHAVSSFFVLLVLVPGLAGDVRSASMSGGSREAETQINKCKQALHCVAVLRPCRSSKLASVQIGPARMHSSKSYKRQ